MGFIGYNKKFMFAAVGAPGSTHDSRLLKNCEVYSEIEHGKVLPKKSLNLQPCGEIPLTTVGDSAFPSHSWLLKPYKEGMREPQKRYFNRRLYSARVVSEHAYGMLKGRWRILYKKTECHLDNIQILIMTCILLHNICIDRNDPCKPRWL
ncbi:protein ALP1-like [Xenia sp. Carnegie-2017]|uniref:protein ALP1-like n=1 Tax=Xenia sp. Carnegie-2017 TaxID=2897299 RepID=UPI001F04E789|nr:protein ALP1-like [Xenia sp. Carnegie-2017]